MDRETRRSILFAVGLAVTMAVALCGAKIVHGADAVPHRNPVESVVAITNWLDGNGRAATCTGTLADVAPNGVATVITCAHGFNQGDTVYCYYQLAPGGQNKPIVGRIVLIDQELDLAAIATYDPGLEPLPLAPHEKLPGEYWAIGYGQPFSVTRGSVAEFDDDSTVIHGSIQMGDSGGTLLDPNGRWCGVTNSRWPKGDYNERADGLTWCRAGKSLETFVEQAKAKVAANKLPGQLTWRPFHNFRAKRNEGGGGGEQPYCPECQNQAARDNMPGLTTMAPDANVLPGFTRVAPDGPQPVVATAATPVVNTGGAAVSFTGSYPAVQQAATAPVVIGTAGAPTVVQATPVQPQPQLIQGSAAQLSTGQTPQAIYKLVPADQPVAVQQQMGPQQPVAQSQPQYAAVQQGPDTVPIPPTLVARVVAQAQQLVQPPQPAIQPAMQPVPTVAAPSAPPRPAPPAPATAPSDEATVDANVDLSRPLEGLSIVEITTKSQQGSVIDKTSVNLKTVVLQAIAGKEPEREEAK